MRRTLTDTTELDAEIARQREETKVVAELAKAAISENAVKAQSQGKFSEQYESLTSRYESAAARLQALEDESERKCEQDKAMARFIRSLKKQPDILTDWDDAILMVWV